MTLEGRDITVVGAGVGGATAALLLARAGAAVTLLERAPVSAPVGAGILLQPNGLAVLADLGLTGALFRVGHAMRSTTIRSGGRVVHTVRSPEPVLALRRSVLQSVLLDAVAAEPRIDLRFDAEVTGADPTGTVELIWDGRSGTLTADLVVGADGVHSVVRGAGDFGATVRPTGRRYVRALVPRFDFEGEEWLPGGILGGAPVDATTTYLYASSADLLPPELRSVPLIETEVSRVDCRSWHDGRIVLLGDAAHAMAPNLGQGANATLVDAAVLTTELTGYRRLYPALEQYTRRRLPEVTRIQNRSDRVARMATIRHPVLRGARDLALRLVDRKSDRDHAVV
ncbi:MAG TPA: NAD(P)/FAD-dependent oxidoreductase [Actinoplanes sp.]|nr:NAD(P)/FAD-dependent oxidoreductase [Actinoplanes sp.]